jgi:hypothetical protein
LSAHLVTDDDNEMPRLYKLRTSDAGAGYDGDLVMGMAPADGGSYYTHPHGGTSSMDTVTDTESVQYLPPMESQPQLGFTFSFDQAMDDAGINAMLL